MLRLVAAAALALAACRSTAPHTLGAAPINTGAALAVSARERAAGGCWAVCAHGTVCNERTGYCEPASAATSFGLAPCPPGRICPSADQGVTARRPAPASATSPLGPAVGVSPATGAPPPTLPVERPAPPATPAP
jgi:hypothetical protein